MQKNNHNFNYTHTTLNKLALTCAAVVDGGQMGFRIKHNSLIPGVITRHVTLATVDAQILKSTS